MVDPSPNGTETIPVDEQMADLQGLVLKLVCRIADLAGEIRTLTTKIDQIEYRLDELESDD